MKSLHAFLSIVFLLTTTSGQAGTCCRTIQQSLANVAADNDFSQKVSRPGTIEALMSDDNRAGFEALDMQDPNGRTRVVQVRYTAGLPTGEVATTKSNICTAGSTESELFANVTTNYYREVKLTLNDGEFETFCASQDEFRAELTRKKLNALYSGINQAVVTDVIANYGNWYDEGVNTVKQVPLINTDGSAQYWGEQMMLREFQDAEILGTPIMIGHGLLTSYANLAKIGCCNTGGVDMSQTGEFSFYRDAEVDKQSTGANHIIALAPGAAQFVSTNDYVGQFEKFDGTNAKTTLVDPATGLTYDMSVYYNWCEDGSTRSTWVITFGLNFGLFYLPDNLNPATNSWEGVNGIFHFQATCGDANVCDNQS